MTGFRGLKAMISALHCVAVMCHQCEGCEIRPYCKLTGEPATVEDMSFLGQRQRTLVLIS